MIKFLNEQINLTFHYRVELIKYHLTIKHLGFENNCLNQFFETMTHNTSILNLTKTFSNFNVIEYLLNLI